MTRWRWVVGTAVVVAVLLVLASALLFDWHWPWIPWRLPTAGRTPLAALAAAGGPVDRPLDRLAAEVASLLAQYLAGVMMLFLVPHRMRRMLRAIALGPRELLRFLAIGLLLTAGLAAVGVLAMLSVHLLPLPFLLLAGLFAASLAGCVALAYALGHALLAKGGWSGRAPLWPLAMGTLVLFALTRVPFLGMLVLIVTGLTGAGVAVATRFGSGEPWSLTPLLEDV